MERGHNQLRSAYAGEKERTKMRRVYPILTDVKGFSRSSEGVCALRTSVGAMKRQQQLSVVVVGLRLCLNERKETVKKSGMAGSER